MGKRLANAFSHKPKKRRSKKKSRAPVVRNPNTALVVRSSTPPPPSRLGSASPIILPAPPVRRPAPARRVPAPSMGVRKPGRKPRGNSRRSRTPKNPWNRYLWSNKSSFNKGECSLDHIKALRRHYVPQKRKRRK